MNEESISNLSTSGFLLLLQGVRQALECDDNLPDGQESIYKVREYSDWRAWSDSIESELNAREVKYQKLPW